MSLEEIRNDVEEAIAGQNLPGLMRVCTEIDLEVPDLMTSSRNKVYRFLLTHLWQEADKDDEGFATYKIVHEFLSDGQEEDDSKNVKTEVATETVTAEGGADDSKGNKSAASVATTGVVQQQHSTPTAKKLASKVAVSPVKQKLVEVQKFQTLKFNGVIGSEKNNISYEDLSSQISNARKVGYTDPIICGAITKAICPGNVLRQYFETLDDLEVDAMLDVLQPYFKQTTKDSGTYYTDLTRAKQRPPDKSAMDFLVRCLALKNRVISLSAEEGAPFQKKLLFRSLHKTIVSGLKNHNIRAEVRESIKSFSLSGGTLDHEYMQVVAEAMTNEEVRLGKFNESKEVNVMESEYEEVNEVSTKPAKVRKGGKNKENLLPSKVDQQDQEIQVLKASVNKLQVQNNKVLKALEENNQLLAQVSSSVNQQGNGGQYGLSPNAGSFTPQNNNTNYNARGGGGGRGSGTRGNRGGGRGGYHREIRRCPSCHENNVPRCLHCWVCGRHGHRIADCPDAGIEQGQGNG